MRSSSKISLVLAALMASTAMSQAADIIPAPEDDFIPQQEVVPHAAVGGWYIRGDIGYAGIDDEADSVFFQGPSLTGVIADSDYDDTWSIQGGIGYQVTDYFRVDATLSHYFDTDFTGSSRSIFSQPGPVQCNFAQAGTLCNFQEDQELDATVLMANAYVDLGTVNGITPYVGAGIGGAHVNYGTLTNTQFCDNPNAPGCVPGVDGFSDTHSGEDRWRFAWALHAGASVDLNCKLKADAGYTFTRVEGGPQFGFTQASQFIGTQGFDGGFDIHEGRIGLRYMLDDSGCDKPASPPIVYK